MSDDRDVFADDADDRAMLDVLTELGGDWAPTIYVANVCGFATSGPMGDDGRGRVLRAGRRLVKAGRAERRDGDGSVRTGAALGFYQWRASATELLAQELREGSADEVTEAEAERLRAAGFDPEGERLDALDEDEYVRWVTGESLTTLQLRGAQHAAERAGEHGDARKLSAEIADREQLEARS